MQHEHSHHEAQPKPFWGSRYSMGLIVFGSIALYFLLTEHRAHFFGVLPFLILLSCPLMHMFMHHGHDHGQHRDHDEDSKSSDESRSSSKGEQP